MGDCEVAIWIKHVRYGGDDVGPVNTYVRANRKEWRPFTNPRKTDPGTDEDVTESVLYKGVLGRCRQDLSVVLEVDASSSDIHYIQATHAHTTVKPAFHCDGTTQTYDLTVEVPDPVGTRKARVTLTLEIITAC